MKNDELDISIYYANDNTYKTFDIINITLRLLLTCMMRKTNSVGQEFLTRKQL